MFTVVGFYRNVDTAGNLVYVTPLPDTHIRVEGFNVIVTEDLPYLFFVATACSNLSYAQVESPSLRRVANLDVYPYGASVPIVSGYHLMDLTQNPIKLDEGEPLRLAVAEVATGAVDIYGLIGFSDGSASPVSGEWYTIRCTASGTITANTWSALSLSPVQTLPAGRYAVGGMAVFGGTVIGARLVFVGLPWRPGVTGDSGTSIPKSYIFRQGRLGIWGEFNHDQPPSVEVLCSASGSVTVYLDLMRM